MSAVSRRGRAPGGARRFIPSAWLRWALYARRAASIWSLALGTTEVNWARLAEALPRGGASSRASSRRISVAAGARSPRACRKALR